MKKNLFYVLKLAKTQWKMCEVNIQVFKDAATVQV